mmetsp:Transcript_47555/g.143890  ORF Transcript_47555/g.143890 Transcript_47555/m.143890 type:complete len:82 (+) Transcript_47555:309-554(+)
MEYHRKYFDNAGETLSNPQFRSCSAWQSSGIPLYVTRRTKSSKDGEELKGSSKKAVKHVKSQNSNDSTVKVDEDSNEEVSH